MSESNLGQVFDWVAAGCFSQLTIALGHFLWQGCVIAIFYAVLTRLLRVATANTRYLMGVGALLVMAICLPMTLQLLPVGQTTDWESASGLDTVSTPQEKYENAAATAILIQKPADTVSFPRDEPLTQPLAGNHLFGFTAWVLPYISVLYLFGVVAMLARLFLGLQGGRRLRRECAQITDATMLELVGKHARRMGMRVVPLIGVCGRVSAPVVVGVLRPMILMPIGLMSGLTLRELEAVMIHELAHICRFDPIVNVLQRLVEAMLFFHPAVWWVSRRVSVERENACDDLVLRTDCDRNEYAEALVHMAELCMATGNRQMVGSPTLAATGKNASQFRRRVLRVLQQEDPVPVRLTTPGITASILLVLTLLLTPAAVREMAWAGCDVESTGKASSLPQEHQPVSMTAEEFGALSAEEQRKLLVDAFQRRLQHAENLHYEGELIQKVHENRDGKPGRPVKIPGPYPLGLRRVIRYWQLGDSFRKDIERYKLPSNAEPDSWSFCGVDAQEGLGRTTSFSKEIKPSLQGQVQYPFKPPCRPCRWGYDFWIQSIPNKGKGTGFNEKCLFYQLLKLKDHYQIEAPVAGGKIRLTVPWQFPQENDSGGRRVFLLDPRKGFLPVRYEGRQNWQLTNGQKLWMEERFTVEESRLVGDVWMPIKMTETRSSSPSRDQPDRIAVDKTTVTKIEQGQLTRADIKAPPFPEGMLVQDTVEGVTYTADAQGRPGPDLKLAPNWKHDSPEGWKEGKPFGNDSMASHFYRDDMKKLAKVRNEEKVKRNDAKKNLDILKNDSSDKLDKRIKAGLEILRESRVGQDEPTWAASIRELIEIGKPAVPKLTEELDRTESGTMLRAMGFTLRGIGDPRAVPALIRSIPRTLQPASSDCVLRLDDDPELGKFMAKHDTQTGNESNNGSFSYRRPIHEIMSALEKLTGKKFPREDINFVYLEGGEKQRRVKKEIFLQLARQWADWWSNNWQRYVQSEDEAQLDLIQKNLDHYAQAISQSPMHKATGEFPRGRNLKVSNGALNTFIRSFKERPSEGFLDLDSGRYPTPSKTLVESSPEHEPSKELLNWAEREGVDLITLKAEIPGTDQWYYLFWPVGMKVWRIDNSRYNRIVEELRQGKKLDLPEPYQGPLALMNEKNGEYHKNEMTRYLFITKEGTCGRLQLKAPLFQEFKPGAIFLHQEAGLRYDFIYEDDAGE